MAIDLWYKTEASLYQRCDPYMHFISLWEWEEAEEEYPCPYFFFCGSEIEHIRESLRLLPPSEQLSLNIHKSLCNYMGENMVQLFEDRETQPGMVRLLIDFNIVWANPNKVTIESTYNSNSNIP